MNRHGRIVAITCLKDRKNISATNAEAKQSFELAPSQWNLAEKVINLLQPFEEATEDISSETSSVALFIPIVNSLGKLLQVDDEDYGIMTMKGKMLLSMQTRFGSCEGQDIYFLSTTLDPRLKNTVEYSQAKLKCAVHKKS